jgi:succinate dehydrogenase/fumarate reductase-like Fe-S protein
MEQSIVRAMIWRGSSEGAGNRRDMFFVPYSSSMTVQTLLRYIHDNFDPTLAFRDYRCGNGLCNTCVVKVNGRKRRACETLLRPGEDVRIEPAGGRVIRDLVTELG